MQLRLNQSIATGLWIVRVVDLCNGEELERFEYQTKHAAVWQLMLLADRYH